MITFEYDGKSYDYDEDAISVFQGVKIEAHTGGTLFEYSDGLLRGSAKCYQALGWILFRHSDIRVPIESVDFPVIKLANAYLGALRESMRAAVAKAEAAGGEPDPTTPEPGLSPSPPG